MSIMCPRCGKQNRENALYCGACGAELGTVPKQKTSVRSGNWQPWGTPSQASSPDVSLQPHSSTSPDTLPSSAVSGSSATSSQTTASSPVPKPKQKAKSAQVEGIVKDLAPRVEKSPGNTNEVTVLFFKVERFNDTPVPVEMRGVRFSGYVSEGDLVRISGRWKRGEVLRPKSILDLTTGAEVKSSGAPFSTLQAFSCLITLLIVALVVFLIIQGSTMP
jgi:hypothetical protein